MVIHQMNWSNLSRAMVVTAASVPLLFCVSAAASGDKDAGCFVFMAAYGVRMGLLSLFQTLRVELEGSQLSGGFGPYRRTIPLGDISQVAPARYRWWWFTSKGPGFLDSWRWWAGLGPRYGLQSLGREVLYSVPGSGGRAVELTLKNGQKVLFSATNPDEVCAELGKHRARVPA